MCDDIENHGFKIVLQRFIIGCRDFITASIQEHMQCEKRRSFVAVNKTMIGGKRFDKRRGLNCE